MLKSNHGRTSNPRRHNPGRFAIDSLESRVLLTAFTGASISGGWSFDGMGSTGAITFDAAGNVTGGSLNNSDGSSTTPSGTYTLSPAGITTITTPDYVFDGAMNFSKDLIAVSETATYDTLSLLAKSNGAVFTSKDIATSWVFAFNGDTPQSTGYGSFTIGSGGRVGTGNFTCGGGISTINGGSYTISASGAITLSLNYTDDANFKHTFSFVAQMNGSKDVIAGTADDLEAASTDGAPLTLTMIRSSGGKNFKLTDAEGVWNLVSDGAQGTLVMDGNGNFTGTVTDISGTYPVAGNYWIGPKGEFNIFATTDQVGGLFSTTALGQINNSKNFIAIESPPSQAPDSDSSDCLTYLVHSNRPPTLTTIKSFKTAQNGQEFAIPFASLLTNSNAKDADGDTLAFLITAINNGTLKVNHGAVVVGTTIVHPGDEIEWTPGATAIGLTNAFSVKAFDGTNASSTAVAVKVLDVNRVPIFTTVNTLVGAAKNTDFAIPYATLLAATDAVDPDGFPIIFRITGVIAGTLRKNGIAVTAGVTTVGVGDTITWTPPANLTGTIVAFSMAASDGVTVSSARLVKITVV